MVIIYCRCAVCWKPHKMICVALQRICHLNLKMVFTFKLSFEKTFLTCHWAWSNVQDCYLLLKSNLQRNINFSKEISNSKHHSQFLIITIDKTIFDNAIMRARSRFCLGLIFHYSWKRRWERWVNIQSTLAVSGGNWYGTGGIG